MISTLHIVKFITVTPLESVHFIYQIELEFSSTTGEFVTH